MSVPTIVSGQNAKGRVQNRATKLPVDRLSTSRILQDTSLPEASRIAKVKGHVLQHVAIKSSGGRTILMEISGETCSYDRSGDLLISALTTQIQDGDVD